MSKLIFTLVGYLFLIGLPPSFAESDDNRFMETVPVAVGGDHDAQCALGKMYEEGLGIGSNYQEAVSWYRKSAEQGNAEAQSNLGRMYQIGRGVSKDYKEAFDWYKKAAAQDNADAQNNLGQMYENGLGTPKDHSKAMWYYQKAAAHGNAEAKKALVAGYTRSASAGDFKAQAKLAWAYENGFGIERNYSQAVEWYTKAAEQDDPNALKSLVNLYKAGKGADRYAPTAVKWYCKASEQGDKEAGRNWKKICESPKRRECPECVNCWEKYAQRGDVGAQYQLGLMYKDGIGVNQDYPQAAKWLNKAAVAGDSRAQRSLGWMYKNGWGVEKSDSEARNWWSRAAAQGDAEAKKAIYFEDRQALYRTESPDSKVEDADGVPQEEDKGGLRRFFGRILNKTGGGDAPGQEVAVVSKPNADVMPTPNFENAAIGSVNRGEEYRIYAKVAGWLQIRYKGSPAWVREADMKGYGGEKIVDRRTMGSARPAKSASFKSGGIRVGILPFNKQAGDSVMYDRLLEYMLDANHNGVTIIEREIIDQLLGEDQLNALSSDADIIQAARKRGVAYVLRCNISRLNVIPRTITSNESKRYTDQDSWVDNREYSEKKREILELCAKAREKADKLTWLQFLLRVGEALAGKGKWGDTLKGDSRDIEIAKKFLDVTDRSRLSTLETELAVTPSQVHPDRDWPYTTGTESKEAKCRVALRVIRVSDAQVIKQFGFDGKFRAEDSFLSNGNPSIGIYEKTANLPDDEQMKNAAMEDALEKIKAEIPKIYAVFIRK